MEKGHQIRSRQIEKKTINGRAKVVCALALICFGGLMVKVYSLQITHHPKYKEIAQRNTIKTLSSSPERGDIVDRKGKLIAGVRPMYDLLVIPERLSSFRKSKELAVSDYISMLGKFIEVSDEDKEAIAKRILKSRSYERVLVLSDLNQADLSVALENIAYLEGTSVAVKKVRDYPYKGAFLSPLGYVGRADASDIERAKESGLDLIASDYVGKMGLEDSYNKSLYGVIGKETVALDAKGRVVERKISSRPTKGRTLKLTLDADLQVEAHRLMQGRKGAVIVQEIDTGEVLVALSMPDIDPNKFLASMSKAEVDQLYSNARPLFNRVARGQYPPASVVKPFMSLIALEGDFIEADSVRWSGGYFELGGHRFRDWKRNGHGHINMSDALAVSSDVYFYRLANSMGIDYIHDGLSEFGFGNPSGIDIYGDSAGLLPSSDWKRRSKGEPWYGGETLTVGIGQGFFMATPIQINNALVSILNGGRLYRPSMVVGQNELLNEFKLNDAHLMSVKQGMQDVVYSDKGTGRSLARIAQMKMAGKTGTSQVFSTKGHLEYDNDQVPEHLRDHAVWMGYAPMDNPQIAITVFVENGGSGSSVAAPIAQKIVNFYAAQAKEGSQLEGENKRVEGEK